MEVCPLHSLAPVFLCVSHSYSSLLCVLFHEITREGDSVFLRADVMAASVIKVSCFHLDVELEKGL